MASNAQCSMASDRIVERSGFCCLTCKFFNREEEGALQGECRRNAPTQADTYGNALWPMVKTVDRCGQGAKK